VNIISDLSKIAKKENLVIDEITPDMYLLSLIQALYKKYDSTVLALFDDYGAPVTDNIADLEVAEPNATVLRDYFVALKQPDVSSCLRFTLVTGITWYTQISMDSGANHLTDISLKPQYSGLCGFTLDEFEPLFGDRVEMTLARLKTNGELDYSVNWICELDSSATRINFSKHINLIFICYKIYIFL
jgi:hypothetical protein